MADPTRYQWAAWLAECADQADDLSQAECHGLRIAATHLLGDREMGWATQIELDDTDVTELRDRVWKAVLQGRALHGPAAAAEGPS